MMKKFLAVLLVLTMALSLCACDSSDYKEATELYNDGDYEAARAIFAELEDYKDSADMVICCDYELALEYKQDGEYEKAIELFESLGDYEDSEELLQDSRYQMALLYMEEGKYKEAREMFLSFGDYEDSADRAVIAARYMVAQYLEANGDQVEKSSDNSNATLVTQKEGKLWIVYVYKLTGYINVDINIGGEINILDGTAVIVGTDSTSSYAAKYDAEASCEWDISTYANGDQLAWEYFYVKGTTAQHTAYTQDSTMLNLSLTMAMNKTTAHLAKVLEESGLGLTMADIGFEAY